MERLLAAGLAGSLLVGSLGCSTTREIETAPPTPAVAAPDQPSQTVQRALLVRNGEEAACYELPLAG